MDFDSVKHSKYFLRNFNNKFLMCCDICEPIKYMFDMIVSNPPYLPSIDGNIKDDAIYGGQTGVETTLRILSLYKSNLKYNGKIIYLKSSLSDDSKINRFVERTF